jgi:hypothetical protein
MAPAGDGLCVAADGAAHYPLTRGMGYRAPVPRAWRRPGNRAKIAGMRHGLGMSWDRAASGGQQAGGTGLQKMR